MEERTVLVIQDGSRTAIRKRPGKGLLAGLYEFPNFLGYLSREEILSSVRRMGLEPLRIEELPSAKHIFSHIEWRMKGYRVRVSEKDDTETLPVLFVGKQQSAKEFAIPSAFGVYVKYMKEEER